MTYGESERIISNIKYKKGWRIYLARSFYRDSFDLRIVYSADDVVMQTENIFQSVECIYGDKFRSLNETTFIKLIRCAIERAELHEMDEHFLYKNERIFDPHKGEAHGI